VKCISFFFFLIYRPRFNESAEFLRSRLASRALDIILIIEHLSLPPRLSIGSTASPFRSIHGPTSRNALLIPACEHIASRGTRVIEGARASGSFMTFRVAPAFQWYLPTFRFVHLLSIAFVARMRLATQLHRENASGNPVISNGTRTRSMARAEPMKISDASLTHYACVCVMCAFPPFSLSLFGSRCRRKIIPGNLRENRATSHRREPQIHSNGMLFDKIPSHCHCFVPLKPHRALWLAHVARDE